MSRLKIGIFIDSFFPCVDGVIMVVDNYAKRLSEFCDVVVIAPAPKDRKYIDKCSYRVRRVKSIRLPKYAGNYVYATPMFDLGIVRELVDEKFDLIHIHSPFSLGKLGLTVGHKLNVPVIATMHTQFHLEFMRQTKSEYITNTLIKSVIKIFNECDLCWAVNKKVADIFVDMYGYKGLPGIITNGTDLTFVDPKEARRNVNMKYNINNNEYVFLFVGRITTVKNISFIIESMKYLKSYKMKFKMLFVGSGPDEKILAEKIEQCGVQDKVIMAGSITDRYLLSQIYNRADMFIFPSLFDASSLVQVEAASQKTPTIFIDGAATACTVIKNRNGFTAPNDPELFAIEVKNILKNKKLYNFVCENAYSEVYKSWDMLTKEVYEKYLNIIKK